jgi:hypothetical protein
MPGIALAIDGEISGGAEKPMALRHDTVARKNRRHSGRGAVA